MCIPLRAGDEGQRYEVRAKDGLNRQMIIGWSESYKGPKEFVIRICMHPGMHDPKIIDRKRNDNNECN